MRQLIYNSSQRAQPQPRPQGAAPPQLRLPVSLQLLQPRPQVVATKPQLKQRMPKRLQLLQPRPQGAAPPQLRLPVNLQLLQPRPQVVATKPQLKQRMPKRLPLLQPRSQELAPPQLKQRLPKMLQLRLRAQAQLRGKSPRAQSPRTRPKQPRSPGTSVKLPPNTALKRRASSKMKGAEPALISFFPWEHLWPTMPYSKS